MLTAPVANLDLITPHRLHEEPPRRLVHVDFVFGIHLDAEVQELPRGESRRSQGASSVHMKPRGVALMIVSPLGNLPTGRAVTTCQASKSSSAVSRTAKSHSTFHCGVLSPVTRAGHDRPSGAPARPDAVTRTRRCVPHSSNQPFCAAGVHRCGHGIFVRIKVDVVRDPSRQSILDVISEPILGGCPSGSAGPSPLPTTRVPHIRQVPTGRERTTLAWLRPRRSARIAASARVFPAPLSPYRTVKRSTGTRVQSLPSRCLWSGKGDP